MASIVPKPRKDGSISFQVYVRVKGADPVTKTLDTREQAEEFARDAEALIRSKLVAKAKQATQPRLPTSLEFMNETLRETVRLFLASPIATKRHKGCGVSAVRHLGGARLCEWRLPWARAYISKMRARNSRAGRPFSYDSIVQHLTLVKTAVKWRAEELGFPVPPAPDHGPLLPPGHSVQRDRRLLSAEQAALFSTLREKPDRLSRHWRMLVKLALETGARLQELQKAEWREFEIDRRVWTIPAAHTKSHRTRAVPLSKQAARAAKILWMMREEGNPLVFHPIKNAPTASGYFHRLSRKAGVVDFRFHDLRHEAISRMVLRLRKLSVFEIMSIVGHESLSSLIRYANLRGDELAERMD